MNKRAFHVLLCSVLWLVGACDGAASSSHTPDDAASLVIADGPATGVVGNTSWTFVAGTSNATLTTTGHESIILCSQPLAEPCGFCESAHQVHALVPSALGSHSTGADSLNVRFATVTAEGTLTTSSQIAASAATVVLTAVSDTQLEGGLAARSDMEAGYEVSGQFVVARCTNHFEPAQGPSTPE